MIQCASHFRFRRYILPTPGQILESSSGTNLDTFVLTPTSSHTTQALDIEMMLVDARLIVLLAPSKHRVLKHTVSYGECFQKGRGTEERNAKTQAVLCRKLSEVQAARSRYLPKQVLMELNQIRFSIWFKLIQRQVTVASLINASFITCHTF